MGLKTLLPSLLEEALVAPTAYRACFGSRHEDRRFVIVEHEAQCLEAATTKVSISEELDDGAVVEVEVQSAVVKSPINNNNSNNNNNLAVCVRDRDHNGHTLLKACVARAVIHYRR